MIQVTYLRPLVGLTAAAALVACSVGPDYQGPPEAAPLASRAVSFHRASVTDSVAANPPAEWWQALGDPLLDRLITTALGNSPTIQQAEASLRNTRATISEQRAGLFPKGSASGLAVRAQLPTGASSAIAPGGRAGGASAGGAKPSYTTNLFDAGFDATWEIDIFGGTRRAIESARASADAQAARLADAQVQVAAEVAQAYVNLRDAQRRFMLIQRAVEVQQRMLDLMTHRRALGTASDSDMARLQTQAEQTAAQVPTLQAQADQYLDQIAVLEGIEPGQLDADLSTQPGALPLPPASVAVGDPASMLRRRPDIRQAERQFAASNAKIGQQVAEYFPKVTLFGTIGFASPQAGRLFNGNNLAYLAGPSLSWNILDFGQIAARVSEAEAGRDEAMAQYRDTVLSALQDAETALSRYGRQRVNVAHLVAAETAAAHAAELGRQRYDAGTVSLIDTLDVERQRVQTEQDLAQARAMLTNDYVSLQKALGLGWSAPENPGQPHAESDGGARSPG